MEFLKNNKRFSFKSDGQNIWDTEYTSEITQEGNTLTSVYCFKNGLKVTNIAKKYENFDAYEWVNYIENTSDSTTGLITELYDCDIKIPFSHEDIHKESAYLPDADKATRIFSPIGSLNSIYEFHSTADRLKANPAEDYLFPGVTKEYKVIDGRSSEDLAPFFCVHKENSGIIFAIGWSGKWNADITRSEDDISIRTKIEDTSFRLYPGEKIRTSSFDIMLYNSSLVDAHNKWRRFLRREISPIGKAGKPDTLPLCAGIWGGMPTPVVIDRVRKIKENNLPYEYIWMDAGWYGTNERESHDEFGSFWWEYNGDWRPNKHIHPNGLKDVAEEIRKAGLKFLLWFEPERVSKTAPIFSEHPEYFLLNEGYEHGQLLNLGDEAAFEYCYKLLSDNIREFNLDCLRIDFNIMPLKQWRKNDAEDRKGITEIKYVMNLYRLLDRLNSEFPSLLIDNCASGGRRIDIEMTKRSVPLWRSDAQCGADYPPEIAQVHNMSFSNWMPYSGTGTGREYDEYRIRSAYAGGLNSGATFSEVCKFGEDKNELEFLHKYLNEYLSVREYFYGDVYPLTKPSDTSDTWSAVRFELPRKNSGIVQIFRREHSPYTNAQFEFLNVCEDCVYTFTDADSGEKLTLTASELDANGLSVTVSEKRKAKLYYYEYKKI